MPLRFTRRRPLPRALAADGGHVQAMAPLFVLAGSFLLFLVAGRLGVRLFRDWVTCLRFALAAMFLLTASAHWGSRRDDLVRMVPPALPDPELLVTLTGIAELAGAVGLLIPRLAPWAACGLALLLIAVFPANVHAAQAGLSIGGRAAMGAAARGLVQLIFLAAVLVAGFAPHWRARHGDGLTARRTA
jgi:uncharacterized membrane protein